MKIRFARPLLGHEEADAAAAVIRKSKMLTNAGRVAEFEERFAEHIGVGQAVAVSSCTAALYIALKAVGVKPGDEVMVPAQTFVASAHAVEACGAVPVFLDSWRDSGVLDPDQIAVAISDKTRAIMVVHYAGRPCYMGSIMAQARKFRLKVVEDCATALGARHSGKHVGLLGHAGCFSFHPVKHLTTGEGGMVVGNNIEIAVQARLLREFGKVVDPYATARSDRAALGQYDVATFGLNFRMTEMQAAIGLVQLPKLAARLAQRRSNYQQLKSALRGAVETLDLGGNESAAYCLVARLPEGVDRDALRLELARRHVETTVYYPGPVPLLAYYKRKYGYKPGMFPAAEDIANRCLALPVGPHLGPDEISHLATVFKECLSDARVFGRGGGIHRPSSGPAIATAS